VSRQRLQASNTLSTALYTRNSSIDFTTRVPVYVGGTVNFGVAGMGPTVEEEVEGLKGVVDVVLAEVGKKNKEGREGKGGL